MFACERLLLTVEKHRSRAIALDFEPKSRVMSLETLNGLVRRPIACSRADTA